MSSSINIYPHKVGDNVYFSKTRKVSKTIGAYLPAEAQQDLDLKVGSILKLHTKNIATGDVVDVAGVCIMNPAKVERDTWPLYVQVPEGLEPGSKLYAEVIPVDILEWFKSQDREPIAEDVA